MKVFSLLVAAVVLTFSAVAAPPSAKESLAELQEFVGAWRGVGQLRRGSNKGAWIEQGDWAWDFSAKKTPALKWSAAKGKGKYFGEARLLAGKKPKSYVLSAKTPDGKPASYSGAVDDQGRLVLVAEKPVEGAPDRVTVRLIAKGARLVVLYERRTSGGRFLRMSEVGFTRKGSQFGKAVSYVECVVTGGKGTMPVTFEGKSYYVCCSGCRDYFNDDPAGAIAEYKQRKAEEKKAKEKKAAETGY